MKQFNSILVVIAIMITTFSCTSTPSSQNDKLITTPIPQRSEGQKDVLLLATEPLPTVRVAFIGLGMRGPGAVYRMTHIPGVEVVALCDVEQDRVQNVNQSLVERGFPKALEFYGDTEVWRQVTALPNVDLVYIATDWLHHAKIGIQAMKDGKHVAIEVPGASTLEEIWELVDTAEKTRRHCMHLENCTYDLFELTTLNMASQGLFGEVVHGEGAYIHDLTEFWSEYWNDWRMDYNRKHRGDLYPIHGLGPVCQVMNIHRGDKLNYLVSVDSSPITSVEYLKERKGEIVTDFRNGEHTSTLLRTEKGKSILIEHNVNSPRPYSRMYQLTGTKGFANKYPIEGYALHSENLGEDIVKDHEDLTAHKYVSEDVKKALMEKYKHPIMKGIEEKAKQVGGHGGMDFIMDYRLIYCLQNGYHLDMDVYDLAERCSIIPLSEISLDNNSAPVEIPDFTRGAWNKLDKLRFAGVE